MRESNEANVTEQVLEQLAATPDPRVRALCGALVRHLHAFVREVEPSQAELAAAIEFLTRTGQSCDGKRQEFVLLSDVLGVSMLVDAINHRCRGVASESTLLGPFYVEEAPAFPLGADLSNGVQGQPMLVQGLVSAAGGGPLAGATVEVWHPDGEGWYDVQRLDRLAMRGRLTTDGEGRFRFWSIRPSAYPLPVDGPVGALLRAQGRQPYRPCHVHFLVRAPGFAPLVTHLFEAGDRHLDSDPVFGVKRSLVVPFVEHEAGRAPDGRALDRPWVQLRYDFVLQPETGTTTARGGAGRGSAG